MSGRPLGWFLTALVLSVLIPALILTGLLLKQVTDGEQDRARETALTLAKSVAADIDREMDGITASLVALATSPFLTTGNYEAFYQQALTVAAVQKLHVLLRRIDGGESQQILNTRVAWGDPLPRQPLNDADARVIETREPQVSDLIMGGVTRRWVIGASVPVVLEGRVVYLLTMSIDPTHIRDLVADSSRDARWTIAITDRAGRIITRSRDHEAFVGLEMAPAVRAVTVGEQGVNITFNLGNERVLRAYRRSTGPGWTAAVFTPIEVIEAPLFRMWHVFFGIAATLAAIGVPAALFLGRQITSSIDAARDAAVQLGRGELVTAQVSPMLEANQLSARMADASRALIERTRSLATSEARFRSVFHQSAVGFEQIGLDGRVLGVNDRLCEWLGYTREECEKLNFSDLTYADDRDLETPLVEKLLSGASQTYEVEKRMLTKSGQPMWMRVTSALVRDPDGKPAYRTSIVEDVTERRHARETAARLAAIVQASPDAMIRVSWDGVVETWNPGAERMLDRPADMVVGKPLVTMLVDDQRALLVEAFATVKGGSHASFETRAIDGQGREVDVALTASPIASNGDVRGVSIVMEDIRDRKRRERQITLLNRELAHRVKNTIAVIQSIANQTMRSNAEPEAFRQAFQGRLQALSAANDLLMQTSWDGADFAAFVDRALAPLVPRGAGQFERDGPAVRVPAELSIPLGLAFHELGTNALKYGAWSTPAGRVRLSWSVEAATETGDVPLTIAWDETGGPTVRAPTRRGFGTTLVERGIPGATVTRDFRASGLKCDIRLVLPAASPEKTDDVEELTFG